MEFQGYSSLWKAIIRPPRAEYDISNLGPKEFVLNGQKVIRTDIELANKFGNKIQCSHFEPLESEREWFELPCVIYMHGNSSCRMEAVDVLQYIIPQNITLFCFDFAGCGLSEGEYISLGWYERDDLAMIVNYLREQRRVSTIGLWGRSMGAVTSLLHGDRDPSIAGMVLDSPFSNMKVLVNELAKAHTKVPSFLVSTALKLVASTIKGKAKFDIYDLSPIDHVNECFIPAMFGAGDQDDFILPHHSQELHDKYAGDKNFVKFEGDHNSARPSFFFDSVVIFFINTLQVNELLTQQNKCSQQQREILLKEMIKRREQNEKDNQQEQNAENYQEDSRNPELESFAQGFDVLGLGQDSGNSFNNIMFMANSQVNQEEDDLNAAIKASLMSQKEEEAQNNDNKQKLQYQDEQVKNQNNLSSQQLDDLFDMTNINQNQSQQSDEEVKNNNKVYQDTDDVAVLAKLANMQITNEQMDPSQAPEVSSFGQLNTNTITKKK